MSDRDDFLAWFNTTWRDAEVASPPGTWPLVAVVEVPATYFTERGETHRSGPSGDVETAMTQISA